MLFHFEETLIAGNDAHMRLTKAEEATLRSKLTAQIAKVLTSANVTALLPGAFGSLSLNHFANVMAGTLLGHSIVLQLQAELSDVDRQTARAFADALVRVGSTIEESRLDAAIGKLAEVLLPDEMEGARGVLAADNLDLRDRFVREIPQLTSTEVNKQSGSSAKNTYATAARWKKNGEIFSVQHRGNEFFPAFQFRDGRPHPAVKRVLAALPEPMTAWQKALWFVSANGWLDDDEPVERLDDMENLLVAARHERDEVIG